MGDAVDKVVALAGVSRVEGHKRTTKSGKIVSVEAYVRSLSGMGLGELQSELTKVRSDKGSAESVTMQRQAENRERQVLRQIAAKKRASGIPLKDDEKSRIDGSEYGEQAPAGWQEAGVGHADIASKDQSGAKRLQRELSMAFMKERLMGSRHHNGYATNVKVETREGANGPYEYLTYSVPKGSSDAAVRDLLRAEQVRRGLPTEAGAHVFLRGDSEALATMRKKRKEEDEAAEKRLDEITKKNWRG